MVKVVIDNRRGSVEHYAHFLLGFAIPLVHFHLEQSNPKTLVVRECGPMTRILNELPLDLHILPKEKFLNSDFPDTVRLRGFDDPDDYDFGVFKQFRDFVRQAAPPGLGNQKHSPLLLVERDDPLPFYSSPEAESQGAGSERRSIRNHREISGRLASRYPSFANVKLENYSLYDQCFLFEAAEVLVAQYGAALVNMVFMKEDSKVIEIGPRSRQKFMELLAKTMKLKYRALDQASHFPKVDADELCRIIDSLLGN